MAANLPVFTDEDRKRAVNKKASDIAIPFVYETVIAWGCKKNDTETYLGYYKRLQGKVWNDNKEAWEKEMNRDLEKQKKKWSEENKEEEEENFIKKYKIKKLRGHLIIENWSHEEEEHLERQTCDGLDATLLHKLVPTICDGIGRYNPNLTSSTEIEKFLREVKNKRNDICHDPKEAAISGTILDEIETCAINVFNAAGVLYASFLDKQKVLYKIYELKKILLKMKEEVMTGDYQRILQAAKKIAVDGVAEMRKAVMKQATVFLPLSDDKVTLADVFHPVDLLINEHEDDMNDTATSNNQKEETKREILCHELLHHFEGNNVLCEGVAGTGKTTLLKSLRQDFLAQKKEKFWGVRKFDLLLQMECRNNLTTTTNQLLEQHFPKTLLQLNKEDAVKALVELHLLICVDGLDELTTSTRKLLAELIGKFGHSGNASFIFTSRPGGAQSISLGHQTVTLQPVIGEKRVEFLSRYQANIRGFKGSDLITAFQALNDACKACLCHPINLALFCGIFRSSPGVVEKWKNELNIMDDFLRLSKKTLITRMNSMDLENTECFAEVLTNAIADLSLCLLQKEEMTVGIATYTRMCRGSYGPHVVPYYAILSSFFTRLADQQTFEFFHKSTAEFLAAKAILRKLLANPTNGVFDSINAIISTRRGWTHNSEDGAAHRPVVAPSPSVPDREAVSLKKFENVLRFVCMLLAEGGSTMEKALQRFLEEVCPALVREQVGLDYWIDLVVGCLDSDEVAEAVAKTAHVVPVMWTVQSYRSMTAMSKLLYYHQHPELVISPQRGDDRPETLATLLKAVSQWHTGLLRLYLQESHANYSGCDDSLACLESAQCGLSIFEGCLRGDSDTAWRALIEGVKRWQQLAGQLVFLRISLLHPRRHELDQLDGTLLDLCITARPPSSPGDEDRRPLPTGSSHPPELRVDCRPVSGGKAPINEEVTAFIVYLAPRNMKYIRLSLLYYSGPDGALDGIVATLRAQEVLPLTDSSIRGWREAVVRLNGCCDVCRASSHLPGERCVEFRL